ncbi:deoxynucleotide monophosphate kinase family protein [Kitasatospora fiedleri]|uniref:deoxynucleotide monophosphate kinase family protein n=1 Tax=Kitasatospora fiedleri TaxID=2991545 RepID=UPI00249CE185|nr:hypothetical protein [Kitasatospora fiedleri]
MHIGIIGRARVGKDTAGAWLVENRGYARVAFADVLKEAALKIDPQIIPDPWPLHPGPVRLRQIVDGMGWERAKGYPEARRFLQELGASIRAVDPEFWIRAALQRVDEIGERTGCPTVITDVRYPNEVAALRDRGFHLLYIDRPGIPHLTHESEGALGPEDADYTVMNVGSVTDLESAVQLFHRHVYDAESARQYGRSHE